MKFSQICATMTKGNNQVCHRQVSMIGVVV